MTDLALVDRLEHLAVDLFLVSILAFFTKALKNRILQLIYIPFGIFALMQLHHNVLKKIAHPPADTFEQALDGQAELLIELKAKSQVKTLIDLLGEDINSIKPAFDHPDDPTSNMDEYFVVDVKDDHSAKAVIRKIKSTEGVVWAEPNQLVEIPSLDQTKYINKKKGKGLNDPLLPDQWVDDVYNLSDVHKRLKTYKSAKRQKAVIAILDTGVDAKHEDLAANYKSLDKKSDSDGKGHGTHCAGIAAAVSNNQIGIASLIPDQSFVELTSFQVLNKYGFGTQQQIIKGILKAADAGVDVISMSLGMMSNEKTEKAYTDAVKYANKKKCIVVVAAGNASSSAKRYSPANTPGVICVAAIGPDLKKAKFSNTIDEIEMGIAAPGVNILSTMPGNKYVRHDGTSMAAPFVAGLVGLLRAIDPKLDTKAAYQLLIDNARQQNGMQIVDPSRSLSDILSK